MQQQCHIKESDSVMKYIYLDSQILRFINATEYWHIMEYNRPLNASDSCDYYIIPDQPVVILFAGGNTHPSASWPYNSVVSIHYQ